VNDAVVFAEIPSGSRNKYEYDPELGGIVLDAAEILAASRDRVA